MFQIPSIHWYQYYRGFHSLVVIVAVVICSQNVSVFNTNTSTTFVICCCSLQDVILHEFQNSYSYPYYYYYHYYNKNAVIYGMEWYYIWSGDCVSVLMRTEWGVDPVMGHRPFLSNEWCRFAGHPTDLPALLIHGAQTPCNRI